ncbi:MAG: tetratricopeptide repeat protein [Saprospiraceae bacterium]
MSYRLSLVLLILSVSLQAQLPSLRTGKKTWAVIAGVSDYQHKEITDLQYAHRDASAFYEFLRSPAGGSIPDDQIQLLLNEQATMARFASSLDWLIEKAGEGDEVFIYFAGHGDVENKTVGQHGFLLPWDSPARSYIAGAYPLFYLQSVVSTLSLQNKAKVIMVADACHSGKLAGASVQGSKITTANLQQTYANEVKILACGPDELSVEGQQWGGGRGAFSFHLIDGLSGLADTDGNFQVNLFELRRYLEDKVPAETAPNSQYPVTTGDRNAVLSWVDPQVLALIKKEKSEQAVPFDAVATRGLEDLALAQTDTSGQRLYDAYQLAVAEKRLLEPENHCAYHYFQLLSQKPEFASLAPPLRRNLAVALQDDAQQAINAYLEADPLEMAIRWKEGSTAYEKTPAYLEKAIELLGAGHYMKPALLAKQRYYEAMLLRMKGDGPSLETALEKVQEAISLEPKGAHLFNELGLIRSALGDSEKERQAYQEARALAPAWVMPVYNLSIAIREQGNLDSALLLISNATGLSPGFAPALIQQAQLQYLKGLFSEAEATFEKSLALAPEDANAPEAHYFLGNIYLKSGRPEEAKEAFEKTIRLDPVHPYAHFGLGIALKELKEDQQAIEAFLKNLEITPEYLSPYYSISILYAARNNQEQALTYLEKALEKGYRNQEKIAEEPAFEGLRQSETFRKLMEKYFPK